MRFTERLIVPGAGNHNNLSTRLAPAREFLRHRNRKQPVFLAMNNENRKPALRKPRLRMPDGRNKTSERTRGPTGHGGVAKRRERLAQNQALRVDPMNCRRGHAAAKRKT